MPDRIVTVLFFRGGPTRSDMLSIPEIPLSAAYTLGLTSHSRFFIVLDKR